MTADVVVKAIIPKPVQCFRWTYTASHNEHPVFSSISFRVIEAPGGGGKERKGCGMNFVGVLS